MVNVVQSRPMVANQMLQYPFKSNTPGNSAKKSIPTERTPSVKQRSVRPIRPKNTDTTQGWRMIQWGSDKQSRKLDGKFGPARPTSGWNDCWFMAVLAAVSNDQDGQKLLAKSIHQVRVEGIDGYFVTFIGSPKDINKVFISKKRLKKSLDIYGGDADTRLLELSADRFFSVRGHYKAQYIEDNLRLGMSRKEAEKDFWDNCRRDNIQNPLTFNPMRDGGFNLTATLMLTNRLPERLRSDGATPLKRSAIMAYLNRHVANDRDGASLVMTATENPLGDVNFARGLVIGWDAIRTDIRANGRVDQPERDFLHALINYLDTPDNESQLALEVAAFKLNLPHIFPESVVGLLIQNQKYFWRQHRNVLRSGVEEVLNGGPGYIGFAGGHSGTITGINEAANTFTYNEPTYPTMVHTGELSALIQAIQDGKVIMGAVEPKNGDDEHIRDELLEQSSWDPPLNHIYAKRSPLQKLRLALATLNVRPVRQLADYLESLDGKGVAGNDRFGLYGVWKLSQLPLDSPHWGTTNDGTIRPQYRQMIKDMAVRLLNPKYKSLMDGVHGNDGIFDPGELAAWLSTHHRNGAEPDSIAFNKFYTSVKELNEKAVPMMEYLEWKDDPTSDRDNHRFGMRGVQLLSRLTPESEQWDASGSGHLDHATRQRLIHEAKLLMRRDYQLWTFQVHQGDMIFEPDDMQNWLDHSSKNP